MIIIIITNNNNNNHTNFTAQIAAKFLYGLYNVDILYALKYNYARKNINIQSNKRKKVLYIYIYHSSLKSKLIDKKTSDNISDKSII